MPNFGLPTELYAKIMQFDDLYDITIHTAINKYSRNTIYDDYYKCVTKYNLIIDIGYEVDRESLEDILLKQWNTSRVFDNFNFGFVVSSVCHL